jgi:cysteinyl-tRNA synthetase
MKIYNSLTNRKEIFKSIKPGMVTMYNCGPTVYGIQSIGNYRSFLVADLLKRYLIYKGYQVKQIMNITDVGHLTNDSDAGDDKLEKRAQEENKDPKEIATFYEEKFKQDIERLKINKADKYPRATEHIDEMIKIIQILLDKGYAYEIKKSIYFDLAKFPEYGKLSGNSLEDLIAGKRVEIIPEKKNPYDFALWIHNPKHIMQWQSPWGSGYPGWHLECSVMANKYLGETIDIHTGGEDNKFPHHECEIAQSEAANGKKFVNYWIHIKHLLVNGGKMSKSLGNVFSLQDIEERGYSLLALRYFLISGHYRQNLNFTFEGLKAAENTLTKIHNFISQLKTVDNEKVHVVEMLENFKSIFQKYMDDDLNISGALSVIFDLIKQSNKLISANKISKKNAVKIMDFLKDINSVLGVMDLERTEASLGIQEELIELLILARAEFKKNKNWVMADKIRNSLSELNIQLKDTENGTIWEIKG